MRMLSGRGNLLNVRFLVLLAAVTLALGLAACGGDDEEAAPPPPPAEPAEPPAEPTEPPAEPPATAEEPSADQPVYGLVTAVQHPYYEPTEAAVGPTCDELGCEVIFVQPTNCDAQEETTLIRDVMIQGVDGLGVSACDAAGVEPTVAEIRDENGPDFPIVTFDADCCQGLRTIAISNSDEQIGVLHAQAINDLLPEGGTILNVVGGLAMQNVQARLKATEENLNPNITMDVVSDKNDLSLTPQVVRDSLTKNPDYDLILTQTGSASTIAETLEQDEVDIPVVGVNAFEDILEWVRKGRIAATVALNSGLQGELAIRALDHIRNGLTPSEDFFGTGGVIVTSENVDNFQPDVDALNEQLRQDFEALWQ